MQDKPRVIAFNKIDLISDPQTLPQILRSYQETGQPIVLLSALDGRGIPELLRILTGLLPVAEEPELSPGVSRHEGDQGSS
jgi:50S ribosomal subunit-associated GTPase HflX